MDDLISRQTAIDAVQGIGRLATLPDNDDVVRMSAVEYVLFNLPSAQIRCKDCAKREHCRTSTVWAIPPKDDWYCADAERRTDEM